MGKDKIELSDEDLMRLYQTGDYSAFETLYQRHSKRVFDFLQKRTDVQNARDLLQEAFLRLHRFRHQYSAQYPFLPWMFTITRNALVDFARLNETKVAKNSSAEMDMASKPLRAEVGPDWTGDLTLTLGKLPENQRRAIELRYLSDWSFEKIAANMETTPINVRQLVSRGIKRLRSKIGGSK